jgi:hypothetical protein
VVTGVVMTLPGGGRVLDLRQSEPLARVDGGHASRTMQLALPAGRNDDLAFAFAFAMAVVGPGSDGDHPPMTRSSGWARACSARRHDPVGSVQAPARMRVRPASSFSSRQAWIRCGRKKTSR